MKISVISAKDLDAALITEWDRIQRAQENLASPYYRPEFTQMVAGYGQDVRVAILEGEGKIRGFFPYQMDAWGRLDPVAGKLNDYHGIVGEPEQEVDIAALLKACGARYLGFNHMPLSQKAFAPYVRFQHGSPVLDVQGGWDSYVKRLSVAQNKVVPGIVGAVRKSAARLEREHGQLRFETGIVDSGVLEILMTLKSEQRARTVGSTGDPFAVPWIRQMMFDLVARRDEKFGGELCALYAGDRLIACHLGLKSLSTLHSWFPVYVQDLANYQPGLTMYLELAKASGAAGIHVIDMGRGAQSYKLRMATRTVPMGEGAVSRPQVLSTAVMSAKRLKFQLKNHPRIASLRELIAARRTA